MCPECGYLHGHHSSECTRSLTLKDTISILRTALRNISIGGIGDANWSVDEIRSYAADMLNAADAERSGSSRAVRGPPAASDP